MLGIGLDGADPSAAPFFPSPLPFTPLPNTLYLAPLHLMNGTNDQNVMLCRREQQYRRQV